MRCDGMHFAHFAYGQIISNSLAFIHLLHSIGLNTLNGQNQKFHKRKMFCAIALD